MANSLLKTNAHNSFADGIYKEILSRATRYYYFLGKTLTWIDETHPPVVVDSKAYERETRNEIISMKEITPSDIAYVIPRENWTSGIIYDIYDDQYSTEIQGLNLISGGTIYASAPTITIGDIVPTLLTVLANAQYYYNNFLYTVTTAGTTGSSNSVLLGTVGSVYNHGSVVLTCVGVQATATCIIGTSGVNNQKVISTTMVSRGSGYKSIPTVSFSVGTASAIAVLSNGVAGASRLEDSRYYALAAYNVYVCISNNNNTASTIAPSGTSSSYLNTADGYTWKYMSSIPASSKFLTSGYMPIYTANQNQYSANGSIINLYIDNPGSGYLSAASVIPLSTPVLLGEKYYYNGYVYTVTVAGTTSASYSGLGTTIGLTYVLGGASVTPNGIITTITVNGDGINAALTPIITDGKMLGVQINNSGTGYSYANFSISGAGTSAIISATFFVGISQYSNQAQIEASTIVGNICSIKVVSGGYGYTSPTISISGDGSGATATATVLAGIITKITITSRGSNYNWATLTITDTTGAGAIARSILSPFGGLGKDSTNQLCCRSLMFYSKISDNTNQGLSVSNNYRQVGIIKDPNRYRDGTYLTSNFATTCWKVIATTAISLNIYPDDILTVSSNSIIYRFRVVSISIDTILLIPLDNGIPTSGMQFIKSTGVTFTVGSATVPTVDKYSGDMLFIDNEASFVSTVSSPSILRTVINF